MRDECITLASAWVAGKKFLEVLVEERLWLTDPQSRVRHSGQPDYLLLAGSSAGLEALIVDYKAGRIAVEDPAENAQLRDLVVLADARVGGELVRATVQIIQPFAGKFTPTVYGPDDISRAADELLNRIRRSNDPNSPRVAGEAQCRFCRAKLHCDAFTSMVGAILPQPLTVERAREAIEVSSTVLPQIDNLKLVKILDLVSLAEKWLGLIKTEARSRLRDNPQALPGWELRPGVERSAVTEVRQLWQKWSVGWPNTTEQFLAAVKVSKTDLKQALREVSGLKGRALTEAFESLLAGCTTTTVTSPRLLRVGEEDEAS